MLYPTMFAMAAQEGLVYIISVGVTLTQTYISRAKLYRKNESPNPTKSCGTMEQAAIYAQVP